MPTLADLQAESWWGREIVTDELRLLGRSLCAQYARPVTAAGTKGDQNHLRGAHRSQEWILNSRYCTNRTYTVQSGLTADQMRLIAGLDFTPGSDAQMIAQSRRIRDAMKAGHLNEVREFYGNVDGDRIVDGWDNVADRAATSDSSHLWHWHLTIDRRQLRNTELMDRIFAVVTGSFTSPGDDMASSDEILAEIRAVRARLDNQVVQGGLSPDNALFYWLRRIADARDEALQEAFGESPDSGHVGLAQLAERLDALKGGSVDTDSVIQALQATMPTNRGIAEELVRLLSGRE